MTIPVISGQKSVIVNIPPGLHINDTNASMWKNKETNKSYCTSYTYVIARYNKMTTIHMYN